MFSEYHGFNLGVAALPFLSFIVAGVPTFAAYVAYYKCVPYLLLCELQARNRS